MKNKKIKVKNKILHFINPWTRSLISLIPYTTTTYKTHSRVGEGDGV